MEALHTNHFVDFDCSFFYFRFIFKFCLRKMITFNLFFIINFSGFDVLSEKKINIPTYTEN